MGLVTPVDAVPLGELGRVHFTGIGGAGIGATRTESAARHPRAAESSARSAGTAGRKERGWAWSHRWTRCR